MKLLSHKTYNSYPSGLTANRWSHDRQYGIASLKGWHITLVFAILGNKYVLQLRHDA